MKVSVLKQLEKIILPGVLIIVGKMATVFILSAVFGLAWVLDFAGGGASLFLISFPVGSDLLWVSSLSDLVAIVICTVGFSWVIFRFHHYGEDSVHPALQAKLLRKKQHFVLIDDRQTLYEGAGWLFLTWLVLAMVTGNTLAGNTNLLIFGLGLGIALVLSCALILAAKKVT